MSDEREDAAAGLASGLEAAGALIESLEEEVAGLRQELESATAALKSAQEDISARADAGREVADLLAEISDLKRRHSDELLRLGNEHITEVANVRRTLEEQRRQDVAAALSQTRVDALKREFARERAALEERHKAEVSELKGASEAWEEELRAKYTEQEQRHETELATVRREAMERIGELERSRDEEIRRRVSEEWASREERHEAALQALKSAAAGRELELQRDYQAVVETQQAEIESLRQELDSRNLEVEEARKEERQQVKAMAEGRERELRRSQASRLAEARQSAARRVTAIQAQREADNRALRARHAEELTATRRDYEQRLAAEDERRRSETWALEERLREADIRRETELRAYGTRLKELEASHLAEKVAIERDRETAVEALRAELSERDDRISALQEELEEAASPREAAAGRARAEETIVPEPTDEPTAREDPAGAEAQRVLAEERMAELEARLVEATEEARRNAQERDVLRKRIRLLSDPERKLREGIALFNASEHARVAASISRSFGLPKVHAGLDGRAPGKPVLTLLWGDVAWRRYVSDPTEGVPEPRVYLAGTGDDPSEVPPPERQPNARMDAQGQLKLGVQAR
jgi:hypothetical protein